MVWSRWHTATSVERGKKHDRSGDHRRHDEEDTVGPGSMPREWRSGLPVSWILFPFPRPFVSMFEFVYTRSTVRPNGSYNMGKGRVCCGMALLRFSGKTRKTTLDRGSRSDWPCWPSNFAYNLDLQSKASYGHDPYAYRDTSSKVGRFKR